MRYEIAMIASAICLASAAVAQEQQAGNQASTNADETFKQLIAKCDNTDALVLRARIRLQLGRTTDNARDEAGKLMEQGLSQCGEGKLDEALATLKTSLDIAQAGVTEKFGQDGSAKVAAAGKAAKAQDTAEAASTGDAAKKPWWKFW